MKETLILPEMLEAGMQAYHEARLNRLSQHDTVIAVFLAMRVVEEIWAMRKKTDEALH